MAKKSRKNKVVKRRSIDIEDKIMVLAEDEAGKSHHKIAEEMGFPRPTVIGIIKNRAKILEEWQKGVSLDKKRLRKAKYPELEDQLYEWIERKRERKAILSQHAVKVGF